MPSPGFYNDNEYRNYPFVPQERNTEQARTIAHALVDAGFVMGLDADFNFTTNTVWLDSVLRQSTTLVFSFKTDAHGAINIPLTFVQSSASVTYQTEFAASAAAPVLCAAEPIWDGFITTYNLPKITALLAENETLTFSKNEYQIEPGRIQNLAKSYLRSISVGNYSRTKIPDCGLQSGYSNARTIVLNAQCIAGDVKLKEGYNCQITQTDPVNLITLSASKNSGADKDETFCEHGSEIPQHPDEQKPENSVFYSGGPACDELIFTINGVSGKNINIVGGNSVIIQAGLVPHQLNVELQTNAQNLCQNENSAGSEPT